MKRVLTALVLIPVVLLVVFLPPAWHWVFASAVAGVAALAAWEFLGLAEQAGATPPRVAVIVAILALFAGSTLWPDQIVSVLGILMLALLLYCTFFRPVLQVLGDASTAILGLVYVGFTLMAFPALHEAANGPSLVTFLLCIVWAGDSAALYVGKAWGRHKLAPSISPGKTWEGAAGSVAGSLAAAGALLGIAAALENWNIYKLTFPEEWWYWLGLAALVNIAAQAGDLAESALKRSAGVKDSGAILPGHGGVLDRIDALLIAAPVLWYAHQLHMRF
jgi:phosphatidate cytidylyltransferase